MQAFSRWESHPNLQSQLSDRHQFKVLGREPAESHAWRVPQEILQEAELECGLLAETGDVGSVSLKEARKASHLHVLSRVDS